MTEGNLSRRGFIDRSTGALLAAGIPAWFAREAIADDEEKKAAEGRKKVGPNDEIVIGLIGSGGQGTYVTKVALKQKGVRIAALCDVDATRRDKVSEDLAKEVVKNGGKLKAEDIAKYADFRELVARDDLNAVVVGTVDHWHAMTSIAAMKNGLDVYCEKPLALTIAEGQAMLAATRKYDRIFQTGNMQRSDPRYRLACELVRNGRIGKVHTVEARIGQNPVGGPFRESSVPEGLDWDFWKGPTPDFAYIKERCHYEFRWWYEYSGGKLTDWGAHHNDIAQWGLDKDETGPVAVTAVGTEPPKDPVHNYNCHESFAVTYEYDDGTRLVTTSEGENGNRFIGDDGWIFVSRGRIEASDPKLLEEPLPADAVRLYNTGSSPRSNENHMVNFLEGVRTRKRPICDVSVGHHSANVCHLGAIALRLGRPLRWDPKAEQFTGPDADKANAMVSREYRSPWKLEV
ncbi:Gfo/Idh/MocA family protein [Tundrisphaera lichenicola]|uniref:Gfo/Idh/MocA family protein n=1 Tax=Tundrisphaera lichenicola TaxID=2029860 RepID=UPI003EBC2FC1